MNYIINLLDIVLFYVYEEMYTALVNNNLTLYSWVMYFSFASSLLFHWIFTSRYVYTTLRLPLFMKHAHLYCEMVQKVLQQRLEQEVTFTAEEIEDHKTRRAEIKRK